MQQGCYRLHNLYGLYVTCLFVHLNFMRPDQAPELLNEMCFEELPEFDLPAFFFYKENTLDMRQKLIN